VKFGSTDAASYTVNSANSITAKAPAGSGTVDVTVTTVGGTSAAGSADQFAFVPATRPVFYGVAEIGGTVAPQKISGTLGAAFFEGKTSKSKVSCTGGTAVGEITGPTKTVGNVMTFTGCETGGLLCHSSGDPGGTIKTAALDGVLGNVSATMPGIRLFAPGEGGKSPKTGSIATFECAGGAVRVVMSGSVIGSLSGAQGNTPAEGTFAASNKLTFAVTKGAQKYTKFLAGECGGNANDCGPEGVTSTINGTPELSGQSVIATLKTVPFAGKLGFTK
jgi:hypothetical protein